MEPFVRIHSSWRDIQTWVRSIVAGVIFAGAPVSLGAQWFTVPSPRAPRTAAGAVDLNAATPRLANGKPDLSGVWMTAEPLCVIRGTAPISELLKMNPASRKCPPRTASFSRQSINIGIDMPGGLPYQPWLAKLVDERTANQAIDDPHIRCLPDFFLRAYGLPHYRHGPRAPRALVFPAQQPNGHAVLVIAGGGEHHLLLRESANCLRCSDHCVSLQSPQSSPTNRLAPCASPRSCQLSQLTATEAAAPPLGSLKVPPCPTGRFAMAAGTCVMRLKSSIPLAYAMSVGPPSM